MPLEFNIAFQRKFAKNLILLFFIRIKVKKFLGMLILLLVLLCTDACHAVFLPVILQWYVEKAIISHR